MKRLNKFLLIFIFVGFAACESNDKSIANGTKTPQKTALGTEGNPCPLAVNPDNPYDNAGQLHNELLNDYLTDFKTTGEEPEALDNETLANNVKIIAQRVDSIAKKNPDFQTYIGNTSIKSVDYLS